MVINVYEVQVVCFNAKRNRVIMQTKNLIELNAPNDPSKVCFDQW